MSLISGKKNSNFDGRESLIELDIEMTRNELFKTVFMVHRINFKIAANELERRSKEITFNFMPDSLRPLPYSFMPRLF